MEVLQDPPEVDARLRVDPRGRLVEEQHLGAMRERAGDHQPLREPARQLEDHRSCALGERELLEELVGAAPGLAPRDSEEAPVVVEVLTHGELAVERVRLGDDADAALHRGGMRGDVESRDECASTGRDDRRREHPDRRRLAGAVRPEQPEELAGAELEVDSVDGFELITVAAVGLAQCFGAGSVRASHRPAYAQVMG